jgi:YfiR/HmsC-like
MPSVHPKLRRLLAALLLFSLAGGSTAAADAPVGNAQIIAERICSVAHFVEWPAKKFLQPDAPFVIGVFGNDSISGLLRETIQDRRIKERPVVVRKIMTKEELRGCHLLFISRSERDRLDPVLRAVRRENILTVGESDNFIARGGVINLVSIGETIRLQISVENARRESLVISSKLLQLALPPNYDPGEPAPR